MCWGSMLRHLVSMDHRHRDDLPAYIAIHLLCMGDSLGDPPVRIVVAAPIGGLWPHHYGVDPRFVCISAERWHHVLSQLQMA